MEDLFQQVDQPTEETLREQLTQKWLEKFPNADPELLKTKVDADVYIKMLERQKDELRIDYMKAQEEIQQRQNLQNLIDQLNAKSQAPIPNKPEENKSPQIDLNEIEKLIESKYEQKRLTETENINFNRVQNKLRERFGNNAGEVIAEQANTLRLSKEEVNALAKRSPEAFFRMMGLDNKGSDLFQAPLRSDLRNDSYAPKTVKKSWNYYQDLKSKNPNLYWDPKTQLQMHKDAEELGRAFEDGDFNY